MRHGIGFTKPALTGHIAPMTVLSAVARDTIATLRAKIAVLQQKCGEAEEATTEARIAVRDALRISTMLAGGLEEARAREAALVAALEDMASWSERRGSELHDAGAWAHAVRGRCEAALGAREAAIRLAKKREADLAG